MIRQTVGLAARTGSDSDVSNDEIARLFSRYATLLEIRPKFWRRSLKKGCRLAPKSQMPRWGAGPSA
jgi:hypothetical protein